MDCCKHEEDKKKGSFYVFHIPQRGRQEHDETTNTRTTGRFQGRGDFCRRGTETFGGGGGGEGWRCSPRALQVRRGIPGEIYRSIERGGGGDGGFRSLVLEKKT